MMLWNLVIHVFLVLPLAAAVAMLAVVISGCLRWGGFVLFAKEIPKISRAKKSRSPTHVIGLFRDRPDFSPSQ
jgi:hypothetical protein